MSEMREAQAQIAAAETVEAREAAEKAYANAKREWEMIDMQGRSAAPSKDKCVVMREAIKGLQAGKREIVLAGSTNSIENSGAIDLTIHDLIPTLNEGLGLPEGIRIQTGVTGNELWPVSVNDAEAQEVGENAALSDNALDFDKITPVVKRVGVMVDVSNAAIDHAAFNVLQFVQGKITLAQRKYLAARVYSQYPWGAGNVAGPFSGLTAAGTITFGTDNVYQKLLEAVAAFADKGFDIESMCIVMDAATEAKLKATPKAEGQGGFIIENGKCAGYNYVVSHYINTTRKGGSGADKDNIVPTADKYIGFGLWDHLAVQQHGAVRLTQDNSSKAMAQINKTNFTMNTEWSITDLSVKLNAKGGTTTQAFALYKLA